MRRRAPVIPAFLALVFSIPPSASGIGSNATTDLARLGENGPRLVLAWRDGHGLFPFDRGSVAREVESIFGAVGVEVQWKWDDAPLHPGRLEWNVVLMPSDPAGPGWKSEAHAMGLYVHENGRGQSVYIFPSNVMRALAISPHGSRLLSPPEIRDLSRALARVIAHEVVHAVVPTLPHTNGGLMSKTLSASFLLRPSTALDVSSGTGLVRALRAKNVSAHIIEGLGMEER
jgi:hypothetical protein